MIRDVYNTNNELALLKFNGPYRYHTSGPSFVGVERPRTAYDVDNERALLKFNGPYRLQTSGSSFTVIKRPQIVQTTKVIKLGNVKVYGTPQKTYNVKEEDTP